MTPAEPAPVTSSPPPAAAPAAAPDARALLADQLAMLSRLAHLGMEIAEAAGAEARAAAATAGAAPRDGAACALEPRRDPGLVFARAARAVRLTIALQQRLMKDLEELDRVERRAEQARTDRRHERLLGLVEDAARGADAARRAAVDPVVAWNSPAPDEAAREAEVERQAYWAYERLVDAERGDLDGLSFDEAVAAICADLGLTPEGAARVRAVVQPPRAAPGAQAFAQTYAPSVGPAQPAAPEGAGTAPRPPDPGQAQVKAQAPPPCLVAAAAPAATALGP